MNMWLIVLVVIIAIVLMLFCMSNGRSCRSDMSCSDKRIKKSVVSDRLIIDATDTHGSSTTTSILCNVSVSSTDANFLRNIYDRSGNFRAKFNVWANLQGYDASVDSLINIPIANPALTQFAAIGITPNVSDYVNRADQYFTSSGETFFNSLSTYVRPCQCPLPDARGLKFLEIIYDNSKEFAFSFNFDVWAGKQGYDDPRGTLLSRPVADATLRQMISIESVNLNPNMYEYNSETNEYTDPDRIISAADSYFYSVEANVFFRRLTDTVNACATK